MNKPLLDAPPDVLLATVAWSRRGFHYSLLGLLPVVGIFFDILALRNFYRARRLIAGFWNPARQQMLWSRLIAAFGLFLSLLLVTFIIGSLLKLFPWQYDSNSHN